MLQQNHPLELKRVEMHEKRRRMQDYLISTLHTLNAPPHFPEGS